MPSLLETKNAKLSSSWVTLDDIAELVRLSVPDFDDELLCSSDFWCLVNFFKFFIFPSVQEVKAYARLEDDATVFDCKASVCDARSLNVFEVKLLDFFEQFEILLP